jgi:glycosyltransferase involved in cell wall biosynthesis
MDSRPTKIQLCNVAILAFPFASPSVMTIVHKLSMAVAPNTSTTYIIGANLDSTKGWNDNIQLQELGVSLHYLNQLKPRWLSGFSWIFKNILAQFKFGLAIFHLRKKIDVVICSVGCYYQIPVIITKLLNKKLICASFGIDSAGALTSYGHMLSAITWLLSSFNFLLSDLIIVESEKLLDQPTLRPFTHKAINGALFIEDNFKAEVHIDERDNIIGFIGRFSPEKGVLEFARSIPYVLSQLPEVKFLIIGSGKLEKEFVRILSMLELTDEVTWLKWINHDEIPRYLNQLKLLVLPSFSEGLPNILLEAIGCETPILATNKGGIPDLIFDRETGFLLPDNTPKEISKGIISILKSKGLATITANAKAQLVKRYSLSAAEERYEHIINY